MIQKHGRGGPVPTARSPVAHRGYSYATDGLLLWSAIARCAVPTSASSCVNCPTSPCRATPSCRRAGVVRRGRADGARRQARRAMVAVAVDAGGPCINWHTDSCFTFYCLAVIALDLNCSKKIALDLAWFVGLHSFIFEGHCYGGGNNGSPYMQHPSDTGDRLDEYLPFGCERL